ncbi:MAG: spore coat protein [Candidatus Desulforudis sp.]|nr:spore coat protein [Desulforudis sp.]
MAYEIFHYMNQKGFYQVPVMERPVFNQMQHMYSPVATPAGGMVPGIHGPFA